MVRKLIPATESHSQSRANLKSFEDRLCDLRERVIDAVKRNVSDGDLRDIVLVGDGLAAKALLEELVNAGYKVSLRDDFLSVSWDLA